MKKLIKYISRNEEDFRPFKIVLYPILILFFVFTSFSLILNKIFEIPLFKEEPIVCNCERYSIDKSNDTITVSE